MSSFVRSLYHFADRLADLPADVSSTTRARTRALVVWTIFSVPIGVGLIIFSQNISVASPTSIGLIIGCTGMALSIRHMRVTHNLNQASLIFVFSALFGLGAASWVVETPNMVALIFLAVTPVYFGLIADWKQCLKYTVGLSVFFMGLAAWVEYRGFVDTSTIMILIACGFASVGAGLSTTAYAYTTARASKKLLKQKDEIVSLAFRDSLTGIYNRRAFNDHINHPAAKHHEHTIVVVDLDNFKAINDKFGHEVGDEVLSELARRLLSETPKSAKSYRVGGDEFAMILHERPQEPEVFARALSEAASGTYTTSGGALAVKISVGIAYAAAGDGNLKRLYYQADTALFEAKKSNTPGWAAYTEALGERKRRRTQLSDLLKTAIQTSSINVAFQPQVRVSPQSIIGYEALARWQTTEFGPISPSEFIAIAEEAGLINRLDRCVFVNALALAETWLRDDQKLAVNVSGKTLLSSGFVDFVRGAIEASALNLSQIQIEITETEIIESKEAAKELCSDLRSLGVSIALDDFGTGYSSLSYLSSLPINTLKIDKSFVQASHQGSNLKIIKSIVGLAKSLGIELMVEGVEELHHLRTMERLGCNFVQGYYFSRPLTPKQCIEFERQYSIEGGHDARAPDIEPIARHSA